MEFQQFTQGRFFCQKNAKQANTVNNIANDSATHDNTKMPHYAMVSEREINTKYMITKLIVITHFVALSCKGIDLQTKCVTSKIQSRALGVSENSKKYVYMWSQICQSQICQR